MLAEIYKALNINNSESIDPDFVLEAVRNDYMWALPYNYDDSFQYENLPPKVRTVLRILDMWWYLENSYEMLNNTDKQKIKTAIGKDAVAFGGFDGNAGNEHLFIAEFLVEKMGKYDHFKGRITNSHTRLTTETHRKMLPVYQGLSDQRIYEYNADQIIQIMTA